LLFGAVEPLLRGIHRPRYGVENYTNPKRERIFKRIAFHLIYGYKKRERKKKKKHKSRKQEIALGYRV